MIRTACFFGILRVPGEYPKYHTHFRPQGTTEIFPQREKVILKMYLLYHTFGNMQEISHIEKTFQHNSKKMVIIFGIQESREERKNATLSGDIFPEQKEEKSW